MMKDSGFKVTNQLRDEYIAQTGRKTLAVDGLGLLLS